MLSHISTGPVMSHLILSIKNKTLFYIIFRKLFDACCNIYSKKNRFKFTHPIELSHIISVSLSKYAKLSSSCCAPISQRYDLNLSYFGLFVSSWVSMISSSKSMALHYYSLFAFLVFLDVWRLMLASILLSTFLYWKYTTFLFLGSFCGAWCNRFNL